MSNKRKQHSSSFKSKVAICAIKGDYTIPEICSKFSISPSCVHKWDCPKFNLKQSNKFLVIISHKANIYIALWLIY
jgi:hypothetical protein